MPSEEKTAGHGDDVNALVIDVGSRSVRCGFAGEDAPKMDHLSSMGKYTSHDDRRKGDVVYPLNVLVKKDHLGVHRCLSRDERGLTSVDTEVFDAICRHIEKDLSVRFEETPVMLPEPTRHSKAFRDSIMDVLFNKYEVPALYFCKDAVLSSFASGRSTSLVIDMGASRTSVSAVLDGFVLSNSVKDSPVGGDFLDQQLGLLLKQKGINALPHFCFKRLTKDGGMTFENQPQDAGRVDASYYREARNDTLRLVKESMCRVAEDEAVASPDAMNVSLDQLPVAAEQPPYILPDGTQITARTISPYTIPERLFRSDIIITPEQQSDDAATGSGTEQAGLSHYQGVPQMVVDCLNTCDADIPLQLLSGVICTGGSSLFAGMADRMAKSLNADDCLGSSVKIKMIAHSAAVERRYSAWIGGSILASLQSFQSRWVSKQEFHDHGAAIAERRCL